MFASPANADITNVYALDGVDGSPNLPIDGGEVADNGEIWAYVTSVAGGVVCLHAVTDTPPKGCDDDNAYAKSYVPPFYTGFVPVKSGNLYPGEWRLIGAEVNDTMVTAESEGFTVVSCNQTCGNENLAKSQTFIAAASALVNNIKQMCSLIDTANMLYRVKKVYNEVDQAVTVGQGGLNVAGVVSIAVNNSDQIVDYVQNGKDTIQDTFKKDSLPGKLSKVADGICKVAEKADKLTSNKKLMSAMDSWAKDPPDPNYQQVTSPDFTDFDAILGWSDWGHGDAQDAMDGARAYAESSLTAFERYQGAQQANDPAWMHAQERVMGSNLVGDAARLRRSAAFLQGTAAQIRSELPDAVDRTVTQDDLNTVQTVLDRVQASGLTAAEKQGFYDAGLDDTAIQRMLVDWLSYSPGTATPEAMDQSLDETANSMLTLAGEAENYGLVAAVNAGRDAQTPVPDFTWGPPSSDLYQVDFHDHTPDVGDGLTIQWNFGDGSDPVGGANVSHHYSGKGPYTVTETVSTDYSSATVSHDVTAGPANNPPTASFTASTTSGDAPLSVHFDASGSSDSDGTVASYTWDYGDGSPQDTGVTADHTFTNPQADGYTVTLSVTDDQGASSTTTKTIVVEPPQQPPTANDDTENANPEGVFDVMANDADPNRDPITISAFTQPSNGTVDCTDLGACTYKASDGYQGPDSFTYTLRDSTGLESAPATVYLTDSLQPASTEPLPMDDSAETSADTPVDVNVLANDSGSPDLAFQSATQPSNGTVSCTSAGVCTYTPNAGFSGNDGFSYTMSDATTQTATANVTVTVLSASAAYSLSLHGSPNPLQSGDVGDWGVGVVGRTLSPPQVGVSLSGDQSRVPGTTKTARGWTETSDGGAQAGPDAVLGDSISVPLIQPKATVSQGTGGDGHVPILIGDRVYAFFHHSYPTSATCIDRRTNRLCPGYPVPLDIGTDDLPGPGVVIGSKIYFHASTAYSYGQSWPLAIFCFDTATAQPCGLDIVKRLPTPNGANHRASTPVLVNGKLWVAVDDGRLYCIDPDTGALCGSLATGLSYGQAGYDMLVHGTKVFVSELNGNLACVDVGIGGPCAGWELPKILPGGYGDLISRHAPDGTVNGICDLNTTDARCWPDQNAASAQILDFPDRQDNYGSTTEEADFGTRTLIPANDGGAACFDWVTLAACTGGDYNTGTVATPGYLRYDILGQTLPGAYGLASDGGCAIGLGDPGLVFSVDPKGFAPCEGVTTERAIDLRDQRCDGTVGSSSWQSVALTDTAPGELGRVQVTVRDATTGDVLATRNLVNGDLDLSGIDPKLHPAIRVSMALVSRPNSPAWDDSIPPRLVISWHPDPEQLCFKAKTSASCPSAPIDLQATLGSLTESDEIKTLSTGCPPPPQDTTPATTPTPAPVPPAPPPSPPAGPPATQLVLGCAKRPVVLEDVFMQKGRVQLLGVADRKFAGKKVQLVFSATGKVVASAVVGSDGQFSATAPLPPPKLRNSNDARYLARIGSVSSLNLKLVRRMLVTNVVARGGQVTISGQVTLPLAPKTSDRTITLQRIVGCSKAEAVTTFMPRANGAFTVTVPAVPGQKAAVYRLETKVLAQGGSKHLLSTFTLPRAVDFV